MLKIIATIVMCFITFLQICHNLIDSNLEAPLWQHVVFIGLPWAFMIWFIWK